MKGIPEEIIENSNRCTQECGDILIEVQCIKEDEKDYQIKKYSAPTYKCIEYEVAVAAE